VTLRVECGNRFEWLFLTTAAQAGDLKRYVDYLSFNAMQDSLRANIETNSPRVTAKALNGMFGLVHISEYDHGTPGTGMVH
jgi:hypothetical protein